MQERWIVTALGQDRPGIVAGVTKVLYDLGCNLEDSAMTRLEGEFARHTPKRLGDGGPRDVRFEHAFHSSSAEHHWIYHPDNDWLGGDIAERQLGGYDMARRIADNDREGIDRQVVFPTKISIPALEEGPLGAALARCYNDWVRELVRGYEERLIPVAIAPAGHPEAMAAELRRAVGELGFKAAHLVPFSKTRTLADEAFHPYYEAAQELDVPLLCHPNSGGPSQNMFKDFFPNHVLGRPFNCAMALVGLVTGGVFEKFPRLRVVFFECGAEWILYWMHRLDDDFEYMQHGFSDLKKLPSELVKRNCYVTCEAGERGLGRSLEEFPDTHVLMASDYPHFDSEFPNTVRKIRERDDITSRQKELILCQNPGELLKT